MKKLIQYEVDIKPCQKNLVTKTTLNSIRYPKLLKSNKIPKPMKKITKTTFE